VRAVDARNAVELVPDVNETDRLDELAIDIVEPAMV
jgi:hypothetical protein